MSKTQITYVYGSNLKSRSNEFQNQKMSIPIPGDTTPNKHGITNAQSILKALGALGNAGMFIFMGYIPHGPGWTDRSCVEGDRLRESPCVRCIDGQWGHLSNKDPCPGWHQVQDANEGFMCGPAAGEQCAKCGPCLSCVSKNGVNETNGEYECIDDWTAEELEEFRVQCLECDGTQKCDAGVSPMKDTCKEAGLSCCHGTCYDPNTECTFINTFGECAVGCFYGEICVDAECVDDPAYVQSLILPEILIP
jgi:hypothetical protein